MRRSIVAAGAALAVIAAVVFVAHAGHRSQPQGKSVKPSAVDIGFAQDMMVHHQQAVLMAAYTREHAGSSEIRLLAATIDAAQQREIGQMVGWLQSWGKPTSSDRPPMSWMMTGSMHHEMRMGHGDVGAVMPGMATQAEMDALVNLTGAELDARFLQLMTRHHRGGLPMAKYAVNHARMRFVRDTARSMILDQQREIDQMLTLMQARGVEPLP